MLIVVLALTALPAPAQQSVPPEVIASGTRSREGGFSIVYAKELDG